MQKITESEALRMYDGMMDAVYGTVEVAGFTYDTSRVFRTVNPTAYRVGFGDYLDMLEDDGYEIVEG